MLKFKIILYTVLLSCGTQNPEPVSSKDMSQAPPQTLTGDFNGDGRRDTIRQELYSEHLGRQLDRIAPDPEHPERLWKWMDSLGVSLRVSCSVPDSDTLSWHGAGLLCLINLGDRNRDGGDDIALVVDLADESRLNSCRVFSLCGGRWKTMLSFQIYEGALPEDTAATGIPGFLEQRAGRWYFQDYLSEEGWQEMKLTDCSAADRH